MVGDMSKLSGKSDIMPLTKIMSRGEGQYLFKQPERRLVIVAITAKRCLVHLKSQSAYARLDHTRARYATCGIVQSAWAPGKPEVVTNKPSATVSFILY